MIFLVALSVIVLAVSFTSRPPENLLAALKAVGSWLILIMVQSAVIIVVAIGQTLLMISGAIDLSVGSVLALSTIVAAKLHALGFSPVLGAFAAVATATLAGLVNGLVTTKARVPAFIATLGMMGMARGLAHVISGSVAMSIPDVYRTLGDSHWFFVSGILLVGLLTFLTLSRTKFGRHNYAVGGNKEAARLSGVNVDKHIVKAFVLNGLIIGIASVLLMGRLGSIASSTSGEGYELDSIAAAVIGGTSLFGGQGAVGGSVIGSLIMAVLRNGCDQLNIQVSWQQFVIGAMIILAVFYDGLRRRVKH